MSLVRGSLARVATRAAFSRFQRRYVSTINAEEVSHFDGLAESWWDVEGSSRLLHRMNLLRLTFINSLLSGEQTPDSNQWLTGYSILDVGCGGGILTESLARLGGKVDGLDASSRAIEVAKAHLRTDPKLNTNNPPKYICGSIHDYKVEFKYDLVTAMEVLEHVDYPASFIKEVAQHVKPGGWLVMSTISRTWQSWLGAVVAAEHILGIVPPGTHSWEKFIKESELREYVMKLKDENGKQWTSDIIVKGCIYNPLRGEWKFVNGIGGPVFNFFFAARRTV
jgi:polyprenyldihydroxybenzoate methyltransferase / 3-demethylubiquinol 3-O-methyltransferase